jgi:hypothetical protein
LLDICQKRPISPVQTRLKTRLKTGCPACAAPGLCRFDEFFGKKEKKRMTVRFACGIVHPHFWKGLLTVFEKYKV